MNFLLLDDNPDNRFLIAKTLHRRFPDAALVECQTVDTAKRILQTQIFDLIVAHRTVESEGAQLVREIRALNATAPILAVSGVDRKQEVLAAGAARFHLLDEWLMIAHVAAELLGQPGRDSNPPLRNADRA